MIKVLKKVNYLRKQRNYKKFIDLSLIHIQMCIRDRVYNEGKPCLQQLIDCYDEYKTSVLGVQTVEAKDVNKYGIVNGIHIEDRVYKVKGLVEKPPVEESPSNVAILG